MDSFKRGNEEKNLCLAVLKTELNEKTLLTSTFQNEIKGALAMHDIQLCYLHCMWTAPLWFHLRTWTVVVREKLSQQQKDKIESTRCPPFVCLYDVCVCVCVCAWLPTVWHDLMPFLWFLDSDNACERSWLSGISWGVVSSPLHCVTISVVCYFDWLRVLLAWNVNCRGYIKKLTKNQQKSKNS